jgi:hypothetical protein
MIHCERRELPQVDTGGVAMNRKSMLITGVATGWLAVLVGVAGSAQDKQDKYTVKVPGGLAMSEFRG